jgi:hypothetical protein
LRRYTLPNLPVRLAPLAKIIARVARTLKTSKLLRSQKSKETLVWLQTMTIFLKRFNILEVQNNNPYFNRKNPLQCKLQGIFFEVK